MPIAHFAKLFALLIVALAAGCAAIPAGRYSLADDIAEDQQALNDAYGRAVNGQILLNVLRARDRWPRHYTSVSGMNDQPTIQEGTIVNLGPLGLGNAAGPFTGSNMQVNRTISSRPSYGLTPLDTEAINRAVQSPTQRSVFEYYWNRNWPEDVLLLLMVTSLTLWRPAEAVAEDENALEAALVGHTDPSTPPRGAGWENPIYNNAAEIGDACNAETGNRAAEVDCTFIDLVREMARTREAEIRILSTPARTCRQSSPIAITRQNVALIESLSAAAEQGDLTMEMPQLTTEQAREQRRTPTPTREIVLAHCETISAAQRPVVLQFLGPERADGSRPVDRSYFVQLRSLDAMVYAMGDIIRNDDGGERIARHTDCTSNAPCAAYATLFRVRPERGQAGTRITDDEAYASVVTHINRRYFAGPAATAGDDGDASDQTASVLTLLTQLFALNHSPGALAAAPTRPVID